MNNKYRKTITTASLINYHFVFCPRYRRKIFDNPKGVEKNTKKKKSLNRVNRQKLSQVEFGTLKDYLKYKAEFKGIIFSLVGEGYTSQTCPACKTLNKPKGKNYVCECGYKTHRDIVGASNILRKKYQCELVDFVMSYKHPIKVSYY